MMTPKKMKRASAHCGIGEGKHAGALSLVKEGASPHFQSYKQ